MLHQGRLGQDQAKGSDRAKTLVPPETPCELPLQFAAERMLEIAADKNDLGLGKVCLVRCYMQHWLLAAKVL